MSNLGEYPSIAPFVDDTDDYETQVSEFEQNGKKRLIVTQRSEFDGGQILFDWNGTTWVPSEADTKVDATGTGDPAIAAAARAEPSTDKEHAQYFAFVASQSGQFSSKDGPDGGNLACVWAVRHLAFNSLGRWITRTDGTSVFGSELRRYFGSSFEVDDIASGGIIISPTVTLPNGRRNIGHVGVLGSMNGDGSRDVYSNSSSRARWEKNFTVNSWLARYRDRKGLSVGYFPLPKLL